MKSRIDEIEKLAQQAPSGQEIFDVGMEIIEFVLQKNIAYGDSALNPVRIFSRSDTRAQIKDRLDDKLSRIANNDDDDEDAVLDLMGYLILLRVLDGRN